jgi:transposase
MTTSADRDGQRPAAEARLFEDLAEPSAQELEAALAVRTAERMRHAPRLREPNRMQVEMRASDLESLLGPEHRARLVWGYVVRQDLSSLFDAVKARGSAAGRAAIDPRVLFALWLYATLEGVGSGREVTRLCQEHDAYRWICGGVSVNYHALNDFRSGNEALMDELLSDNVAALAAAGAISLQRVAQDGMRVRADAGAASFRRQASLNAHLSEADELVRTLKEQAKSDPARAQRQAQAAQLRAAEQREQRIRAALEQLPEVAAAKKRNGGKVEEARASTTDAQARVMKMGDGGFRPAYNVQFATTCAEQVIVGAAVVNVGSDMAQLAPMVEQVEQRLGRAPQQWLVDGGFPAHEQIDAVAHKTEVYAPVPEPRAKKAEPDKGEQPKDPPEDPPARATADGEGAHDKHQRKSGDSDAVAQWRERMGSAEAAAIYKHRAATAECVNAQARNRGLLRMPLRGLAKVKAVVGLYVLAHNLMRMALIAPQLVGWGPSCASDLLSGPVAA